MLSFVGRHTTAGIRLFGGQKLTVVKRPFVWLFAGVQRGCGVTHTALSAAGYFSTVEKRSVCFVQLMEGTISGIGDIKNREKRKFPMSELLPGFSSGRLSFAPSVDENSFRRLLDALRAQGRPAFEIIICDCSGDSEQVEPFLSLCDRLVLVAGLREWNYHGLINQLSYFLNRKTDILQGKICSFSASKAVKKQFVSSYGRPVVEIPVIEDPLLLKHEDIAFLKPLLSHWQQEKTTIEEIAGSGSRQIC